MKKFQRIAWIMATVVGLLTTQTVAQSDPLEMARSASNALRNASDALKNADKAEDRVRALTDTIRAYEAALLAMRGGLRTVAIRERTLRLDFESRRDQISRLLGVLQTLERATTPLLLIHPTGPVGTARSGMMLSEVTPGLQLQAEALRSQLEELSNIKIMQRIAEEDLALSLNSLNTARAKLAQAVAARTELPKKFIEDPAQVRLLADTSETLDFFADALSKMDIQGDDSLGPNFHEAKGNIDLPTNATLLRKFREKDAAGLSRPGIVMATPALSLVTAPWSASIRYSGPFLDYGNVILLEPEPDYLIVLAGLSQIYGETGDILAKGDPVGLMSGKELEVGDLLMEVSQNSASLAQESLYIEVRKNGLPLDPMNWFKLDKS